MTTQQPVVGVGAGGVVRGDGCFLLFCRVSREGTFTTFTWVPVPEPYLPQPRGSHSLSSLLPAVHSHGPQRPSSPSEELPGRRGFLRRQEREKEEEEKEEKVEDKE